MRSHFLLAIAVTSCVSVFGQNTIGDRMDSANALIQQGHYAEAIATLTPIEEFNSVADRERGRAETLSGLAYSDIGQLRKAEQLYEKALVTLGRDNRKNSDYASALSLLGRLRINAGDPESGERMLRKAAQIEDHLQDHAGLATVYLHLVAGAIGQKHWKAARKYLSAANTQALLAGRMRSRSQRPWMEQPAGSILSLATTLRQSLPSKMLSTFTGSSMALSIS